MTQQLIRPGLVLSRRVGEVIVIELPEELGGQQIQIGCVQVSRKQVKIGLNCPRSWNIVRGEVRGVAVAPKPDQTPAEPLLPPQTNAKRSRP